MRRRSVIELEHEIIEEAVPPSFRRVIALDDGVLRRVEMPACVTMWRVIAAADMTAGTTQAQVDPATASLETLLTSERTWNHVLDLIQVIAPAAQEFAPTVTAIDRRRASGTRTEV